MSYALVIYRDNESLVTEIEYTPTDNGDIAAWFPFDNLAEAHQAKLVHNIGKKQSAELAEKLEIQAETIRRLNTEIENQKSRIQSVREKNINLLSAFDGLRRVLRRVMAQLALQNILRNTHRERNEEIRGIVADMKYWHDKPIDTYADIAIPDDIPF